MKELHIRGHVDRLLVVFGDQLDVRSPILRSLDRTRDAVLMMEVAEEATHVPSHKQRIVLFLSAMRHFALDLARRDYRVHYIRLDDPQNTGSFAGEIERAVHALRPKRLMAVRPGEWRVFSQVQSWPGRFGVPVDIHEDPHFLLTPPEFSEWAAGRKTLVMEHFYRRMRKKLGILMESESEPVEGRWNFDQENRKPYKSSEPPPRPVFFKPDATTREVMSLVAGRFPTAPGRLEDFIWPVTRRQALRALRDFVDRRLPLFGHYQDAMVAGEPWMFHSLLSPALNLKLLDPREVVGAALQAYEQERAPLNCVEGFIRQIIGWREFIRGVYWHEGPDYAQRNALEQHGPLPDMYWTGKTDMVCMRSSLAQVFEHGYGHHIQRLMVTGNFALIAGIHPKEISDWYLAMYVDAVDWATLPNTLGMAMHADGGVVGTKPYVATGRYIDRMSNYCATCRYDPAVRTGEPACPFTTLYWDFLIRNRRRFQKNRRMTMILKNIDRMSKTEMKNITDHARKLRNVLGVGVTSPQ
ncbi:MAG: cryptochrome/photolyase family protein [Phycisphaerales bacterium]|nr:MAG: cryptochrome/photolyase family protein [Phycisphaerales bacterium]